MNLNDYIDFWTSPKGIATLFLVPLGLAAFLVYTLPHSFFEQRTIQEQEIKTNSPPSKHDRKRYSMDDKPNAINTRALDEVTWAFKNENGPYYLGKM